MSDRPAIRHVVFFSAKDKADIPRIVEGLGQLADIPHAQFFEVRRNSRSDAHSTEVDVIVYAEFASAEDLAAYKAHPIYENSTATVKPLRELRIAADF
ncbi:Dabb family protein [Pontibaca methylaminivorans]|uniref:Dabb family protein n=1 Tax=Pontibaca methylaminivorans TaxID=515897 RepID=UPI002FD8C95F